MASSHGLRLSVTPKTDPSSPGSGSARFGLGLGLGGLGAAGSSPLTSSNCSPAHAPSSPDYSFHFGSGGGGGCSVGGNSVASTSSIISGGVASSTNNRDKSGSFGIGGIAGSDSGDEVNSLDDHYINTHTGDNDISFNIEGLNFHHNVPRTNSRASGGGSVATVVADAATTTGVALEASITAGVPGNAFVGHPSATGITGIATSEGGGRVEQGNTRRHSDADASELDSFGPLLVGIDALADPTIPPPAPFQTPNYSFAANATSGSGSGDVTNSRGVSKKRSAMKKSSKTTSTAPTTSATATAGAGNATTTKNTFGSAGALPHTTTLMPALGEPEEVSKCLFSFQLLL